MKKDEPAKVAALALRPDAPAPYEVAHVAAFQALQRGDATSHQQQLAVKWLIERAAGTYEHHYYPSDRDTAFALGRRFVGQQVVKLLALNLSTLRRESNHVDQTSTPQA